MGEVPQNRSSWFYANIVCIGDIVCQKCRKTVYRLEKNGVGQLESSVPLPFRYQVHPRIQRIQPLVRNSFQLNVRWMIIVFRRLVKILLHIQTSRFLFFFLLESLRRSIFFVANSQRVCNLWNHFTWYFFIVANMFLIVNKTQIKYIYCIIENELKRIKREKRP